MTYPYVPPHLDEADADEPPPRAWPILAAAAAVALLIGLTLHDAAAPLPRVREISDGSARHATEVRFHRPR